MSPEIIRESQRTNNYSSASLRDIDFEEVRPKSGALSNEDEQAILIDRSLHYKTPNIKKKSKKKMKRGLSKTIDNYNNDMLATPGEG